MLFSSFIEGSTCTSFSSFNKTNISHHKTRNIPGVLHGIYKVSYMEYTGCPTWNIPGVLHGIYRVSYMEYTGCPTWNIPGVLHGIYNENKHTRSLNTSNNKIYQMICKIYYNENIHREYISIYNTYTVHLLHTYTVMRPDNAFSALYNNTEQRVNIRAKTQYLVFARILSFCPHTAFRPSPGFATYRE